MVSIDIRERPQPRLIVYFRNEQTETADPALRRVHDEFAVRDVTVQAEPLLQRPIQGFDANTVIANMLRSQEGRSQLAASMVAPLRRRLDYQGVARQVLLVDPLPEGALPTYDGAPQVAEMAVTPGWDGNGSPVAELPLWVKPGVWAYDKRRDEHALVEEVRCPHPGVRVTIWRSPEPARWVDVDYFYENWEQSSEPAEPRGLWERLVDEDFLSAPEVDPGV